MTTTETTGTALAVEARAGVSGTSRLLQYLPAIYEEDPFLGQFLLAFEKVLLGVDDGVDFPYKGLEQTITGLATLFDPYQTPEEFLPWLAEWTAFTMRAALPADRQRQFIAELIPLYRERGTRRNLERLLQIFTGGQPGISEPGGAELQIGVNSTVGRDTYLGGAPPHYFQVTMSLPPGVQRDPEVLERLRQTARDLIDLEKPAHTHYDLNIIFPSMCVGVTSTVGIDTILGTATQ